MTVKFAGNNVIALFKVSMCMSNRSFMVVFFAGWNLNRDETESLCFKSFINYENLLTL